MPPIILPEVDRLTVARILKEHIADYQNQYRLWHEHRKIVYDLLNCRTPYLGGHVDRCDHCGAMRITYHSCRNRHCPTCQHMPRERWLAQRKQEILPADYFHVVFTLPHELNAVVLNNKKVMLAILFKAASQTLLAFGENKLGGNWVLSPRCTPGTRSSMPIFICIAWWPVVRCLQTVHAGYPARAITCSMSGRYRWCSVASSWN